MATLAEGLSRLRSEQYVLLYGSAPLQYMSGKQSGVGILMLLDCFLPPKTRLCLVSLCL